jgi:hypothetical protein
MPVIGDEKEWQSSALSPPHSFGGPDPDGQGPIAFDSALHLTPVEASERRA